MNKNGELRQVLDLGLSNVFRLDRIREMQLAFRRRLKHTVVFMGPDADILVDEAGVVPHRIGQRPHPCEHCAYILDDLDDQTTGAMKCHNSDKEAAQIARVLRKPLLYKCWTSKSNVAIPITVGGMDVIGNLYGGQFFAVLDTPEDRLRAEQLCEEKGVVIHNGIFPEGEPTKSIKEGFFWTREEIEIWAVKHQEQFCREAHIRATTMQLGQAWLKAPRVGYEDAVASVELLASVADILATEAYEKTAYRLHNSVMRAYGRYTSANKSLSKKASHWVMEADEVIERMVKFNESPAATAEKLAYLYIGLLSFILKRRCNKLAGSLDFKQGILDITNSSSSTGNAVKELRSLQGEICELETR